MGAVDDFIRVKSLSCSMSTIASYRSILSRFVAYLNSIDVDLEDVDEKIVTEFLHTVNRNSRRQYYTVLKQFLTYIGKGDVVLRLPKIRDVPRSPRAVDIELVLGGIARLLENYSCSCYDISDILNTSINCSIYRELSNRQCYRLARDIIAIWLSLALALRRKELLSIETDDIDIDKCVVKIHRVKSRSNPELQEMEMPKNICMFIKHYIDKYNIHGKLIDLSPWMLEIIVHRFGEMINHPELTHHMLRHTIITHLAKAGVGLLELMKFAHHVNPANTMKYINITMRDIMPRIRDKINKINI